MKITRSALIHLRLPFSFLLLPVFLFALNRAETAQFINSVLVFIVLHLLIYPASNAFNSYFDKDESSIALIKSPPPVDRNLYYLSLILDLAGIVLAMIVSIYFAAGMIIYSMISRMYSHPSVRIKRFPYLSLLIVMLFQGGFIYLLSLHAISPVQTILSQQHIAEAVFCCLLVGAIYPLTQVYQHTEDRQRGDRTISLVLGIRGSFIFAAFLFVSALFLYYTALSPIAFAAGFIFFMIPPAFFFMYWYLKVKREPQKADFQHAMLMTCISSVCMNAFFLIWLFQ